MDPMWCIRSFGWTLSELLPETSWNYDTVRDVNQGRMRWQASWTLQNSEPETFAAVSAYKRAKQVTTQLLPKASSLIKQERSCMLRWQVLWLTSLPALLVHPSEIWVFQPQITTPAAHHCKPWSLHVAPNQLEDGQDSSRFLLSTCSSDSRPHWPRKYDVQGTFKATSLHETTTWTPYACDVEIISKSWSEHELVNSCVGHADTALVSSTCTFLWKQQHCLSSKVTWRPLKICLIWLYLLYLSKKLGWENHDSCSSLITINLTPFIWHQVGKKSFEEHLKWNRDDELPIILDTEVWKWNCLSVGATSQDLCCPVKWRVPQLVDEIDFEEWHWTWKSMPCKTKTAGKHWLFMLLGRCAFLRCCAQWCSNLEAHGTSLSSSRSFKLSQKLT